MKLHPKVKGGLVKKFQKVQKTPASFDFFVAVHDFVEYIEANPVLVDGLSSRLKPNRELNIPNKYTYLKQIYQALEDAENTTNEDLGHTRYAVLLDIKKIKNQDMTDSNPFWKRREVARKSIGEIYERLNPTTV
ncbi:MAG: hypothetical protein G01um101419_76 [Parcubacteria group bacterium Gr01-1014_19]|nr:MAG: hypothetical protein G01um101419_76 [Parcubacteria group bacterium Gr01-1014_19]